MSDSFKSLVSKAQACTLCADELPLGPRPIFQVARGSRILIAGQAPGSRVHETGIPFDDPSGERLREWMGVSRDVFYDATQVAILPIGFCYPGKGKSGDNPPLKRCADTWRDAFLGQLSNVRLMLVIGQYAQNWHLETPQKNLTETVRAWRDYGDAIMPLPHPSPRNNIWLKKNAWFEKDVLPALKARVAAAMLS